MSTVSAIPVGSDGDVVGTGNNANAVATLPAAGQGMKWRVTSFGASFSGAAVATPVRATLVTNGITHAFGVSTSIAWLAGRTSIDSADNDTVVLTLPAGGAGAVGDTYLTATRIPSSGTV